MQIGPLTAIGGSPDNSNLVGLTSAASGRFESRLAGRPPSKKGSVTLLIDAGVAQLAEQLFCKQQVTGSIPVAGSSVAFLAPKTRYSREQARVLRTKRGIGSIGGARLQFEC